MTAIPITAEPQYVIESAGLEWAIILDRLVRKHNPAPDDISMTAYQDGSVIYKIRKGLVPLAELAAALGADEARLAKVERINLKPFKVLEGWQKPTVPYYGVA